MNENGRTMYIQPGTARYSYCDIRCATAISDGLFTFVHCHPGGFPCSVSDDHRVVLIDWIGWASER